MKKLKNPAGKPASKLICLLTLAIFLFALLAGLRFFGEGNAEAALYETTEAALSNGTEADLSEATEVSQNATETDAESVSNKVLTPNDIAEMDTDYAMSSYVNYTEVTEALAANALTSVSSSVFSGTVLSVSSYANGIMLTALAEEPELDTTTQNWFYYIYYVGQSDSYDVTKTDDFSLKYQMEFRTSEDLNAGTVEIRIPAALLTYRNGTAILPGDIAVPAGSPEDGYTYSSKTPMNYYYETDSNGDVWLIFWNYRDITSGTDMAWQVLYRDLDAMSIVDMTTWALDSYVSVDVYRSGSYYEQTNTGHTLTGLVNTATKLTSLTKGACSVSGKNYAPCLYTEKQVGKFISYPTDDYADVMANFDDYVYVVWTVTAKVSGNQPFTLEMLEETCSDDGTDGVVIGYSTSMTETGASEAGYQVLATGNTSKSYAATFYVVTAYPDTVVSSGTTVTNTITAKLTPYDEIDEVQTKTASAEVTYRDYEWNYSGDLFSSNKTSSQTYEAYAEAYKYYYANGMDFGGFPFTTSVFARGYGLTHSIVWPDAGNYITGTYYIITLEDSTMDLNGTELTWEDYYFSSVTVTRTDHGYDIYEDETKGTPDASDIDQDVTIYAMFADNPDVWEEAGTITYDENGGTKSYEFTADQIAREPYAVKAVYHATDYDTTCSIAVNTVIKTESAIMWDLVNGSTGGIILTDTSTATVSVAGGNETYENVYEKTMSASKTFTRLNGANDTAKTVTTTNDAVNERVQLTYNMAAYDGYKVYDAHTAAILEELDVLSPSRNTVVFYDLLPYGVHYDASVTPTAGRLTSLKLTSGDSIASKSKYSTAQVEITEVELTENWEGTGRTMVAFHISYSGADSSTVSSDYAQGKLWYSGWGVSFKAYYDWKDIDIAAADGNENIFAYMPESDASVGTAEYRNDMRAFLGAAYADDGSIASVDTDYTDLAVTDLNGDGETTTANVLYGKCTQSVNIALASTDYITKLVRADANVSAAYEKTASVEEGRGYTYDITVTTIKGLTDLVVFDRLEYGLEDHTPDEEEFFLGETASWKGTLVSIDLTGAELAGAADITIWYNASSDAAIPGEFEEASDYLTSAYGWYTADEWAATGLTMEDVGAFAVDFGDFKLDVAESVTFRVHMLAPEAGEVNPDTTYAFNNSWFSSYSVSTNTYGTVQGNTVRVSLGETYELTVEKEFDGDVPSDFEDTEFEFHLALTGQNTDFSQRIYTLWEKDENGDWQRVTGTYATDYNGYLYLKAGQKAVFEGVTSAEMQEILITETESVFWGSELTAVTDGSGNIPKVTCTFTNTYRAPLYVTKLTTAVPEDVDVSDYEFEITITVYNETTGEWEPYTNSVYWMVKAAKTNGSEPTKLSEGLTGSDGTITIHAGEVAAVFLPSGTQYKVEETETGTDFFVQTGTYSGTVDVNGTAVSINNIYRWKDLNITKLITYQDASECIEEFTFQILHVLEDETTEVLTTENEWYVTDANGDITNSGTLTSDGKFTAACAGCTVTVKGLEAGETYLIKETDSGELYEDVTGSVSVTMPLYSTSKSAEYTNKWLMRDLSVSKYVAGDTTGVSEGVKFTFALYVDGAAAEGYAYQITENGTTGSTVYYTGTGGSFTLENGQTAVFSDCGKLGSTFEVYETDGAGFTRVYPSDDSALSGMFEEDGNQISFVNGESGSLMVSKTYMSDGSTAADTYLSLIRSDVDTRESAAVTLTMEVTTDGVTYTTWPADSVTVEVIDQLNGDSSTADWTVDGITLEPWKTVVITSEQLGDITGYRVSESAEDRHRIVQDEEENYLTVTQTYPADDAASVGDIKTSPIVTVMNKISDVTPEGSFIYKRMSVGSAEPSTGAELVLTVQQYNGSSWVAADGIAYLTFDEAGLTCDRVLYTDSGGKIVLTKSADGYPYIEFLQANVSLNLYDSETAAAGDYRIVEDAEATDTEEWGILAGYGSENNVYEYSLNETEAAAFVNANRTAELKVAKVTDVSSGQSFSFTLSHVLSTDENGNILADEAGANIDYTVYDAGTNEPVSAGTTDALGRFTLTGGQYAVFELADGAVWTVSETTDVKWTLSQLTAETDETIRGFLAEVISENTAQVRTLAETACVIKAEASFEDVVGGRALDKDRFTVTAYFSDGTCRLLNSDEFEITPDTAVNSVGEMEVTVTWKGAQDTVTIEVTEENYNVSYAVAIYGILADTYMNDYGEEQYAGLTLGPATGGDYTGTYRSHVDANADGVFDNADGLTVVTKNSFQARTKDEAEADGVTYCLHQLTWDQIVEQSRMDPAVFADCMEYGCTHSVHIFLNDTLWSGTDYFGMTGDGASVLYDSISSTWRSWNTEQNTAGGWPASRIRATLDGAENGVTTATEAVAGTDVLSAEESLFSCFPSVLRNSIVVKKTASNTVYNSGNESNVKTTYDRLWLFSYKEIFDYTGTEYNLSYEGTQYDRMTGYAASAAMRTLYSETGSGTYDTWLRSLDTGINRNSAYVIDRNGEENSEAADLANGLAPGFCLPGPEVDGGLNYSYNVSYAVAIYGINADTYLDEEGNEQTAGLTFGPATGESYIDTYRSHVDTNADGVTDNTDGLTVVTASNFQARTKEEAEADGVTYCIHFLNWSQIVEQSKTDPTVFEDCLEYDCTHSVRINLSDTIWSGEDYSAKMTGDGASALLNTIKTTWRYWNPSKNNTGGWPSSRIRTMVNQYLLPCFPIALQNSIVAKEVQSNTLYKSNLESDMKTTWDKLWLLSYNELFNWTNQSWNLYREGTQYAKTTKYSNPYSKPSLFLADYFRPYDENGDNINAWLRSPVINYRSDVYGIRYDGSSIYVETNKTDTGIAPGFCLPGVVSAE